MLNREFRTGTVVAEILFWYYPKMCYPAVIYNIATSSEKIAENWTLLNEVSCCSCFVNNKIKRYCCNMRKCKCTHKFYCSIFIIN